MASPTKILFMGFGPTGCDCLQALVDAGAQIVGVFCRESDRTDAGGPSSLFSLARRLGLPLFSETRPNDLDFVAKAAGLAPDYIVSVQYDRILKPALIAVPELGCLNLHFGPLPRLQGCFPTKWAIIEDEPGGVTFHYIDPGIDTGNIIAQTVIELAGDETDKTLYGKLAAAGSRLFAAQVPDIMDLKVSEGRPQDEKKASYHNKDIPFEGIIDWSKDVRWVERFVRAFTSPPHPGARTWLGGAAVELRAPVVAEVGGESRPTGEIRFESDGRLRVFCGEGSLLADSLLLEGKSVPPSALKEIKTTALRFESRPS